MNTPERPVKSPCVNICALDDDDVCTGCQRTVEEITRWSRMTNDERRGCSGCVMSGRRRVGWCGCFQPSTDGSLEKLLWRGSLLPLGREAAPSFDLEGEGLLRSPAGASSLATGAYSTLGVVYNS
jgi:hypothetical protein